MINSMTAYAREQVQGEWGVATWEIRSVNHRYLDTVFKLPEPLLSLEQSLRERLREQLQRGRVECRLQFKPGAAVSPSLQLNQALIKNITTAATQVAEAVNIPADLRVSDILRWPDVVQTAEILIDEIKPVLMVSFDQAVSQLNVMRQTEGQKLTGFLTQQLSKIRDKERQLRAMQPSILDSQQQKVRERFKQAQVELDSERLAHEMVYYTQKIDVIEELDRLCAHTAEVEKIFATGGAVGRKLDFLMQELNREINTLASKSISAQVTAIAVEVKVFIEQMREQIQNIE